MSPAFKSQFQTMAGASLEPMICASRRTDATKSRMEGMRTRNDRSPAVQRWPIESRSVSARTTPTDGIVSTSRSKRTRCFVPDGASRTTASGLIVRGAPSWRKGFRALQGKVNGFCLVPRVFDCTMVEPSETEPSLETRPHGFRLSPSHLTAAVLRQILRGLIVVAIFITFVAVLAAIFGISILQYTRDGFRVSAIVIVAAIGLTLIYGIRGFANFAYGDLMTLGAYVALLVNLNGGLSLVWGAIISFIVLAVAGILVEIVIFSHLEGRGPVPPIVASVGLGLIIQNGIRTVATTQQWIYPVPALQEIPIVAGSGTPPPRGVGDHAGVSLVR